MDGCTFGDDFVDFNAQVRHQPLEFDAVVLVVEAEGGNTDDVDGRLFGFAFGQFPFLAGFLDVVLNDLFEGAIGCLQLVDAIMVHVGKHHVALGIHLSAIDKIL